MTVEEARADLMLAQADISYRPKDDSIDMAIKALENKKSVIEEKEYRMKVDEQYKCKDCDNYNLCEYYHNRRKTSSICKEFRNQWGFIEELEKIKAEIEKLNNSDYGSIFSYEAHQGAGYMQDDIINIIERHIDELEGESK